MKPDRECPCCSPNGEYKGRVEGGGGQDFGANESGLREPKSTYVPQRAKSEVDPGQCKSVGRGHTNGIPTRPEDGGPLGGGRARACGESMTESTIEE